MFDTTKQNLKDLLRLVHKGRLQLPDFQRDYVWGDEDVRSLVASVAKGFPIGALLTLQTGGDVRFKPRLLASVPANDAAPDELLLDGQQRVTSLYQSTFSSEPVRTRTPRGFESRMQALSEIIAEAMEKPVVAEAGTDEAEHDVEIEDDEMAELEAAA